MIEWQFFKVSASQARLEGFASSRKGTPIIGRIYTICARKRYCVKVVGSTFREG